MIADSPSKRYLGDGAQAHLRAINQQIIKLGTERAHLIRKLRDDGCSLREIAAIAGLSHQTIANILARQ